MAARDPVAAAEAIRSDLRDARGPLVEQLDAELALVTFIWIGDEGPVSVRTQLVPTEGVVISHPMSRVPGTDLWHLTVPAELGVVTLYQYVVDDPWLGADDGSLTDFDESARLFRESLLRSYADPYNDERLVPWTAVAEGVDELPESHWESVLRVPPAEAPQWFAEPRQGAMTRADLTLESQAFGNTRAVSVFTPPGYTVCAAPYPLVLFLDGEEMLRIGRVDVGLGNLIGERAIPPVVAAFVHNPSGTSRLVEMACDERLPALLADELVPMLRAEYNVTAEPQQVVIAGVSYGGLASAFAAYHRHDTFGNVLSCSGSHWWGCAGSKGTRFSLGRDGEPEWLTRQYATAERKPIRFWVDVGSLETGTLPFAPGVDHRAANRHFRTVLAARGYDVTYHEARGGHEFATFRESIVKGLRVLLGGRTA